MSATDSEASKASDTRIDQLFDWITNNMHACQPEVQEELARLVETARRLCNQQPISGSICAELELVAKALLQDPPNLIFAQGILDALESKTGVRGLLSRTLWLVRPPVQCLLGLGALLCLSFPVGLFLSRHMSGMKEPLGVNVAMLTGAALAGALGSVVSIMIRLKDFAALPHRDHSLVFCVGFFKPIMGMILGMFMCTVLNGGLVPFLNLGTSSYAMLSIAFVSGFSERFARDVVLALETTVSRGSVDGHKDEEHR